MFKSNLINNYINYKLDSNAEIVRKNLKTRPCYGMSTKDTFMVQEHRNFES